MIYLRENLVRNGLARFLAELTRELARQRAAASPDLRLSLPLQRPPRPPLSGGVIRCSLSAAAVVSRAAAQF